MQIATFDTQPSFAMLEEATVEYETKNGIAAPKKMTKMIKDQSRSIKAWAEAPWNPDEAKDPDEGKNP